MSPTAHTAWWPAPVLAPILALTLATPSPAATVRAPTHATPTTTDGPYAAALLFDQSGLSAGHTAGATEFDTYLASGPTHAAAGANRWRSQSPDDTPWVWLELPGPTVLDALALWADSAAPPAFMDVVADIDGVPEPALPALPAAAAAAAGLARRHRRTGAAR